MVKRRVPNVVRGGIAIPLKDKTNYYYMAGRKHKNGGIDIGENPRTGLEVEDGEVMHVSKDEIKVFSSVPFLNGKSPAQKVLGGENPNTVFKQQEQFKDRHGINDDGTKKKRMGGQTAKRKYTTTLTVNEEKQFQDWYSKVAKHKKLNPNPDADGQDYDYRGYWKNEDRNGILGSNPNAHFPDKYKQPTHPTFSNGSIYSNDKTPGGTWIRGKGTWLFKHNKFTARQADRTADYLNGTGEGFILGTDTIIPNIKKRMGGLSRSKDYGSKSKPYPSVKSEDFAGGHRSYPIPTKADAIDALRLAGLHGRSDVRTKVYAKYPDIRKKSKAGGLYSVTVNGETKLKMFPSTGDRTKAPFGIDVKLEEPKDILGVYRPFNTDGSVNPFYSPTIDGKRRLKEYHRNTNFNEDGTFNLQSYLDRQREDNDPFKLNTVSTNDAFDNNDNTDKKDNSDIISDAIGLTSNTIGGLISYGMNRRMLNRLKYTGQPIARTATKLKTRININPQLDKMRETLAAYERDVDNNTASSRVALARKQRARLANMLQTNELYSTKENAETELINKDRLNQQTVTDANIRDYNNWSEKKAAFRNAVLEKQAENDISLIETLNSGVQNLINNRQKRKSENQTIAAMSLANPNLPIEVFYEQGLVSKKTYDAYKKAYRNKKEDNKD